MKNVYQIFVLPYSSHCQSRYHWSDFCSTWTYSWPWPYSRPKLSVQQALLSKASVGGMDDIGAEIDAVSLHCYGTLTLALFSCPQWTMNTVHMCEKTQWLVSTVDGAGVWCVRAALQNHNTCTKWVCRQRIHQRTIVWTNMGTIVKVPGVHWNVGLTV